MNKHLAIGKLPNDTLKELILDKIIHRRKEVLRASSLGEDTAVLDFQDDYIVLSCDPITGSNSNLGKLGVHISVNDISTQGAEPVGLLLVLLLPPSSKQEDINSIMKEVREECRELNMDLIGGHTEITSSVKKPILMTTVVGRVNKKNIPMRENIDENYIVAVSKSAGLEGTAIIACDKKEELDKVLDPKHMEEAIEQLKNISVLKEGIVARRYRVGYMHDVTESGIEGAIWEASQAIGFGLTINKEKIPLLDSTKEICQYYKIDPYKLISSGSMLVIIHKDDFSSYQNDLRNEGILISRIGSLNKDGTVKYKGENSDIYIESPETDELYKVI